MGVPGPQQVQLVPIGGLKVVPNDSQSKVEEEERAKEDQNGEEEGGKQRVVRVLPHTLSVGQYRTQGRTEQYSTGQFRTAQHSKTEHREQFREMMAMNPMPETVCGPLRAVCVIRAVV
jgi:hypothetical protein